MFSGLYTLYSRLYFVTHEKFYSESTLSYKQTRDLHQIWYFIEFSIKLSVKLHVTFSFQILLTWTFLSIKWIRQTRRFAKKDFMVFDITVVTLILFIMDEYREYPYEFVIRIFIVSSVVHTSSRDDFEFWLLQNLKF